MYLEIVFDFGRHFLTSTLGTTGTNNRRLKNDKLEEKVENQWVTSPFPTNSLRRD